MSAPDIRGSEAFGRIDEQKRQRILDAALDEFGANGYRSASVNRIVKAANISKGSLFHYFGAKQGLFDAIVDAAIHKVKDYLRDTREQTRSMDIFTRLERFLMAGFQFIDTRPKLAAIYFHALYTSQSPFGLEKLRSIQYMGLQFIEDLLMEAQERGEVRSDLDRAMVSFMINAVFERLMRAYYIQGLDPGLGLYRARREYLSEWARLASTLFRAGLVDPERSKGENNG
jgi:AcrR family transcriptional regulator